MRILIWIFRLAIFLVLFGFAVKNEHLVTVNFYVETHWQLPMVFVILVSFAIGAVIGVSATLFSLIRKRREIRHLRKAVRKAEAAEHEANLPAVRADGAVVKAY